MEREEIEYAGRIWYRYPGSQNAASRRYFMTGINGELIRLHRYIWEKAKGPIPKGLVVHHKDGNPGNNDLSNLEMLTKSEHSARWHEHLSPEQIKKMRLRLAEARKKAALSPWHHSAEGREWHRQHAKRIWAKREPITLICEYCNEPFETLARHGHTRFCSPKCKAGQRRKDRKDVVSRICAGCGESFKVNKYAKTQHCSPSCAQRSRRKRERQL